MERLAVLSSVVVLMVAACSSNTAEPATTTEATLQQDTTTEKTRTAEVSRTTPSPEVVDVCRGRGVIWEVGGTYRADCFLVPVTFEPVDGGWRTFGASEDWVLVTLAESGTQPLAEVALLGYGTDTPVASVVESIFALEGLTVVSPQRQVTVGGSPAVTVDVESAPDPSKEPIWGRCHSLSVGVRIAPSGGPGWQLMEGGLDGDDSYGFSPCRMFRVWVVDVGGVTATVLAVTEDTEAFDEVMPVVERLLDSITFERS